MGRPFTSLPDLVADASEDVYHGIATLLEQFTRGGVNSCSFSILW